MGVQPEAGPAKPEVVLLPPVGARPVDYFAHARPLPGGQDVYLAGTGALGHRDDAVNLLQCEQSPGGLGKQEVYGGVRGLSSTGLPVVVHVGDRTEELFGNVLYGALASGEHIGALRLHAGEERRGPASSVEAHQETAVVSDRRAQFGQQSVNLPDQGGPGLRLPYEPSWVSVISTSLSLGSGPFKVRIGYRWRALSSPKATPCSWTIRGRRDSPSFVSATACSQRSSPSTFMLTNWSPVSSPRATFPSLGSKPNGRVSHSGSPRRRRLTCRTSCGSFDS